MVGDEIKLLLHNAEGCSENRRDQNRKELEEVKKKIVAKDQLRNVTFNSILDHLQWWVGGTHQVWRNSNLFILGKSQALNAMINNVSF